MEMDKFSESNKSFDSLHAKKVASIERKIKAIYKKATEEAAQIGVGVKGLGDKPFKFADFPAAREKADKLIHELGTEVQTVVLNGVQAEWTLANNKNSALSDLVFGDNKNKLTKEQYRQYYSNNDRALDAFLQRKAKGLNLSDRVWKYTDAFKNEIEHGLDLGIRSGKSAAAMARELQDFLQYPDKLFRRVRDEHGVLHLSKAAKAFHPGQGVYRSSYMNARRLAVTETNIAYRTADHLRQQQLDFVVGIRIVLSNNHNCKGVPTGMFVDICDELKGNYPKEFMFTGWHPHCRCHTETILKTPSELKLDTDRILAGRPTASYSAHTVKDAPDKFKTWVKDHEKQILASEGKKGMPYFLRDNYDACHRILKGEPAFIATKHDAVTVPLPAAAPQKPDALPQGQAAAKVKADQVVLDFIGETSKFPDEKKYKKIYDAIEHWKEGQKESPILLQMIENSTFEGTLMRGMSMTADERHAFIAKMMKNRADVTAVVNQKRKITSWTKSEEVAKGYYTGMGQSGERVVLKIEGRVHGYDFDKGSMWGNEDLEVALSKHTKLKYVTRQMKKDQYGEYLEITLKTEDVAAAKTPLSIKERAAIRHAARTPEQAKKIQESWSRRRIVQAEEIWRKENLSFDAIMEPLNDANQLLTGAPLNAENRNKINASIAVAFQRIKNLMKAKARHRARTPEQIRRIQDIADERKYGIGYVKAMHKMEEELGLKRGKRMTLEQADKQNANPHLKEGAPYELNCQSCVPAYMMRLHGFNVTAMPNTPGSRSEALSFGTKLMDAWRDEHGNMMPYTPIDTWMRKKKYKVLNESTYIDFWNDNTKEEGVYLITITYNEDNNGGGHATILQRFKDGTLRYIEPQESNYAKNKTAKGAAKELLQLARALTNKVSHNRGIIRIDDKFFNTKAWKDIFNFK